MLTPKNIGQTLQLYPCIPLSYLLPTIVALVLRTTLHFMSATSKLDTGERECTLPCFCLMPILFYVIPMGNYVVFLHTKRDINIATCIDRP